MRLRWLASCVLTTIACGPAVVVGDSAGTDSSDPDDSGNDVDPTIASVDTTASTTATTLSTSVGSDPSTTGPITMTDATTVTVTTDPSTMTDPTGAGLPDGQICSLDEECESGHCYTLNILGGVCGQCSDDSDCAGGGCTPANPIMSPPTPSSCNDGSYGDACESEDVCADELVCTTVFEVPGIIIASTCGECGSDADCAPGLLCAPDIAINALTGVNRCVTPGTLANGQSCAFAATGDESCASGHCAIADVMGLLQIGVCSECEVDGQCGPDTLCQPPQVDLMTGALSPGTCL